MTIIKLKSMLNNNIKLTYKKTLDTFSYTLHLTFARKIIVNKHNTITNYQVSEHMLIT